MTYTDDQRDTARPTPADMEPGDYASPPGWAPNLQAAMEWRRTSVARYQCALACMVGESLARKPGEPVEPFYGD